MLSHRALRVVKTEVYKWIRPLEALTAGLIDKLPEDEPVNVRHELTFSMSKRTGQKSNWGRRMPVQ